MKTAAYVRVSTTRQGEDDRYGIPAQKADIERFAAANGHEIVAWYTDRISGTIGADADELERRVELHQLFADVRAHHFEAVIVGKLDRWARDTYTGLWLMRQLGCEVLSATEPVNGSDPMQQAFREMILVWAKLDRSMIAKRLTGGRLAKAHRGGYAGGRPALGYVADAGKLVVSDAGSATVRAIYQAVKKGRSLRRIAAELNAAGHRTATGKLLSAVTVKRVLDRAGLYSGRTCYATIEAAGQHEAII